MMARCWSNAEPEHKMKQRPLSRLLAAVFLTALAAGPVAAQGGSIHIVPKIGVFTPLTAFGETNELQGTLALGVAAELALPTFPLGVRVNLEHATTTDIVSRDALQSRLGTARLTAIVGQVVLRPFDRAALFQPYLLGGGGVQIYEVERLTVMAPDLGTAPRSTRPTLHIGGGVDVAVGPLRLLLEVGNYMSTLETRPGESRLHHHAFGMVGFRVGML
jgi:hypothetical protein